MEKKRTQSKYDTERKSGGGWAIKDCEDCGNKTRKHRVDKKGRFLCFNCYRKTVKIIKMPIIGTYLNDEKQTL